MAAQQLGQVLAERGSRQHHVAPDLMRLLLQVPLHVRQEADDRSFLQLALEFRDRGQGLGVGVIQIKNDQGWLLFAILLDAIAKVLVGLDELNLDVEFACRLLDLCLKEQVIDEGKDTRSSVLPLGQRLRLSRSVGSKAGMASPACLVSPQGSSVTVIHGGSVNASLLLAVAACGLATMMRASSPTTSVSATGAGGMSGSYVHTVLFFV
jgi:hypothetical protein